MDDAAVCGTTKNETVETNLLNLAHYREATVSGAYGMKKADMEKAVPFLVSRAREPGLLIEAVVPPEHAPGVLPRVLIGQYLKYILDPGFQLSRPIRPIYESFVLTGRAIFC